MPRILYIHGFKSSGNALKAQILKKKFDNVFSPDMPVSPKEAIDFLKQNVSENKPDLVIGSSLGGFYAFIIHKIYKTKTLFVNPSFTPWLSLEKQIGVHQRFVSEEVFVWKKEYNEELLQIAIETENLAVFEDKLNFFLSTDDELLDHSQISQKFQNSNIQYFDNAGHQFSAFLRTIKKIKQILK